MVEAGLEGITKRDFLRMVGIGGIGLVVGLSSEAEAKEQTVDEILEGTPFIEISHKDLSNYTGRYENVFFMVYAEDDAETMRLSRNLVRVVKPISEKYKSKVVFVKCRDDRNEYEIEFARLGIRTVPAWSLFRNGVNIYVKNGGPMNEASTATWTGLMDKKFQQVYNLR